MFQCSGGICGCSSTSESMNKTLRYCSIFNVLEVFLVPPAPQNQWQTQSYCCSFNTPGGIDSFSSTSESMKTHKQIHYTISSQAFCSSQFKHIRTAIIMIMHVHGNIAQTRELKDKRIVAHVMIWHTQELIDRWEQNKSSFQDETAFINSAVQRKPDGKGYLATLENPR